jgi:hypothetical protein
MSIRTKSCACGYSATAKQRFAPTSPRRRRRLHELRPHRYPPHHPAALERQRGPGLVPRHAAAEVRASLKAGPGRERRRALLFASCRCGAPTRRRPATQRNQVWLTPLGLTRSWRQDRVAGIRRDSGGAGPASALAFGRERESEGDAGDPGLTAALSVGACNWPDHS